MVMAEQDRCVRREQMLLSLGKFGVFSETIGSFLKICWENRRRGHSSYIAS
jgi:hypothetical protein